MSGREKQRALAQGIDRVCAVVEREDLACTEGAAKPVPSIR